MDEFPVRWNLLGFSMDFSNRRPSSRYLAPHAAVCETNVAIMFYVFTADPGQENNLNNQDLNVQQLEEDDASFHLIEIMRNDFLNHFGRFKFLFC